MRYRWLATSLISTALTASAVHGQEAPKQIKVPILNATGQDAGFATFKTVKKGVKVKIELKNIEFGMHAVHIHQNPGLRRPRLQGSGRPLQSRRQAPRLPESHGAPQWRHAGERLRGRRPHRASDLCAPVDLARPCGSEFPFSARGNVHRRPCQGRRPEDRPQRRFRKQDRLRSDQTVA